MQQFNITVINEIKRLTIKPNVIQFSLNDPKLIFKFTNIPLFSNNTL